jgi:peptide/nickel transport system permease protein/oligopeptide transport system permease protein
MAEPIPGLSPRSGKNNRFNLALYTGAILVLLVCVVAVYGPKWAPLDPTETHLIFQQPDGTWLAPPIRAFQTMEFPLGTDRFGRDLYSQLLYAVRPTLILVLIVASVRMLIGLFVGVAGGWFNNPFSRFLNNFTNTAATIPAIIVALATIAAVGVDLGVWAFVIGLSITGWADTALLVRAQTRLTRKQTYIEAARAMGANNTQVIGRHLLRQIMPLVWMVFNLEVSGTLMATAGLGFLGYYIGGDAFVQVGDAVAQRVAAQFELGQMLATTTEISLEPWGMVAAGSMVFIAILGFNLLGEGLRASLLSREGGAQAEWLRPVARWWDDHVMQPVYRASEASKFWPAVFGLVVTLSLSGFAFANYQEAQKRLVLPSEITLFVPGGHWWASQAHDAYGTYWTEASGPQQDPQILWGFEDQAGFTAGPAVDVNGRLYLLTRNGHLFSLDQEGTPLWDIALEVTPVGSPGLAEDGSIYVVGSKGSLTRVGPDGEIRWTFRQDISIQASLGPIIDSQGTVYYGLGGLVQAVSPDGIGLWRTVTHYFPNTLPPKLSPDESMIYMRDVVLDAATGENLNVSDPLSEGINVNTQTPVHVVDRLGRTHMLLGNFAVEWEMVDGAPVIRRSIGWAAGTFGLGNTANVGVTPNNTFWAFFAGGFTQASMIWMDLDGDVLGTARWQHRPGRLIGIDSNSIYYFCGTPGAVVECKAFDQANPEERWTLLLTQGGTVNGGAVTPGRLFVTTDEGWLFAIGNN